DSLLKNQKKWIYEYDCSSAFRDIANSLSLDIAGFLKSYTSFKFLYNVGLDITDSHKIGIGGAPTNLFLIPKNKIKLNELQDLLDNFEKAYGKGISSTGVSDY